jgi:glycosyltransferase involved in cell wall biosynthesis
VALCTFNGGPYLRQQLTSILEQDRRPDQLVVCDDGSSDGSVALVRELVESSGLAHRVLQNPTTLGVSCNFAQAIRLCEHDVVVFCDQDDVWRRDRLAQLEAAFQRSPDTALVFSDARVVDARGQSLGYTQWESALFSPRVRRASRQNLLPVLLRYPVVCGATMAVRRESALRCLPIGEEWLHDEWIALLCAATSKLGFVEAPLVNYRIHGSQVVSVERPTFRRQLASAKRMDRAYVERQLRRFAGLEQRLSTWIPAPPAVVLSAIRGKLEYLRGQLELRGGSANPWLSSTRLLFDGMHHRFGFGFKSWLLDVGYDYAFGQIADQPVRAEPPAVALRHWRAERKMR